MNVGRCFSSWGKYDEVELDTVGRSGRDGNSAGRRRLGGRRTRLQTLHRISPADSREVYFTDVDRDGRVSVGDKRVGRRGLKDATGNNIGDRYWIITVDRIDRPGTAVQRHQEIVNVFEDGVIFASYDIGAPNKTTDVTDRVSLPQGDNVMTIVGGTGAYAGARGTIAAKVDGNNISLSFDLTCK